MKRILIALVAGVAVLTTSAKINKTLEFESDTDLSAFEAGGLGDSELTEYDGAVDSATKIAVYLNAASNLVVISGTSAGDATPKTNETNRAIIPGTWVRLTISKAANNSFEVYVDDAKVGTYASLTDSSEISSIGFQGSGALDNFVARTTDPHRSTGYGASICTVPGYEGSDIEKYGYLWEAVVDTLTDANGPAVIRTSGDYYDGGRDYKPYEIFNADCLKALADGVLANPAVRSLNFVQTANIDMASAGAFPGIGESGDDVTKGIAFAGVYDGGGFTISNVTLEPNEYAGVFRKVTGTVKNLTVNNMGFASNASGSFGCAIVGEADNNAVLQNITATGSFCTDEVKATHNTAAIVVNVQTATGNGTVTIASCTNNATVYGSHHRVGGILAYTRNEGNVNIIDCANNGNLNWTIKGSETPPNPRGIAGIAACPEGTGSISIENCVNTGTFTVTGAKNDDTAAAATGEIVGHIYKGTLNESGNTFHASKSFIGGAESAASVAGATYAVAADAENYLTTVAQADLAAGNTYVLLADVAASETPVFTLAEANDNIAFNTNGFNFAGTVAVANPNMLDLSVTTEGAVTTYTAVGGTAVASITEDEVTTEFNTYAKAIAAATVDGELVKPVKIIAESATETIGEGDLAGYAVKDGYLVVAIDCSPWEYSAGIVVWRATSGQLFHASTVADVDTNTWAIGETYTFDNSHPWQVFASNQAAYRAPGATLVFDKAGYNASSDAQFAPLSFGGMWVKALQAENTPYCITDNKADGSDRKVELGATGASTYFKFDESFTFNRNSATRVLGTATVEIASGKTFTINARANKGAVVDAGNTLVLKGAGTLAVVGGLSVSGTLDLSAETVPAITGDVALNGTIVLPAGTEVSSESPFTICSGTLSVPVNAQVKIGDGEAEEKSITVSGGAITAIGDPIYVFYDNYPTIVPAGKTYTFVGGDSAEAAVTVPSTVTVKGTLKTSGFITVPYFAGTNAAKLDVIDGTTTITCGNKDLAGDIVVEVGATLVNGNTDAVDWNDVFIANIYGTLDMGATRWSLGSNNTLNFHEGCTVTGSGQSGNGTFDWIENATGTLNVDGNVSLAAPIRIRSTATVNVNVDTTDQKGLTLAGTLGAGKIVKKGAGLVKFTTNPPYAIAVESGAFTFAVDATPTITYSAKPGAGTTMSMWYATQDTWKGTVVIGDLNAPTALPLDTYGNENSKIVLTGTTGNCYLNGTTTVAAELVIGTNANNVVEFNNGNSNQVGTFNKVSGPGTLKLVGWGGCSAATYVLSTLDNFEGLAVANNITRGAGGTFTIRIGNIVTTRTTNPGDCVLPIANTAVENATGTVVYDLANATVNGNTLVLEAKDDGIYVAAAPTTVTITVPAVANTTVTVVASEGDVVNNGDGTYTVADGATVTVTYSSDDYEVTGGTFEFTAIEGYAVDTTAVVTKQYVAYVVFQQESGQSFIDVTNKYTTVATAIDAAKAMKKTIVLIAQPEATDTYEIQVGETINVKKGEFTFDGIIFPEGPQYNNTTTETAGVTQYKCAVYTATVQYPGEDPQGVTTPLAMILNGLYTGYAPSLVGTVVTVLDGSDATLGDVMPEVFTYDSEAHTYTLKMMVASYYNGHATTYYPTISNAVNNVVAGGTIKLLANVTLDARVEPAKSLTIDLGGYTITREGTSGNGSVFDVKSGNVVITNGVIDCTQDDTAIVAGGVYAITARSGANVTLGGLTVTVNSECGACVYPFSGATVTILSGTYANTTSTPYRYKQAWTGMAVNQANVATQLITIYGGSFKQVNPALGDDSWADGVGTFLAPGYAATRNPSTGYYDVAEVQEVPVAPGAQTEPVDTPEAAAAEAAKTVVAVPEAVASELTTEQQTAYKDLFETKVVEVKVGGDTKYAVAVELKAEVAAEIQEAVDGEAGDLAQAAVEAAADAVEGGTATVTTTPGLYYVVEAGSELNAIAPESCTLATGETTNLPVPNKGTKGFYKISVSVTPVAVP